MSFWDMFQSLITTPSPALLAAKASRSMVVSGLEWHEQMTRALVSRLAIVVSMLCYGKRASLTLPDVLEVLMAEYRHALVRKAHRRVEIDKLVAKAKQRLDLERDDPTGE
jgi:hypothetical protein